MKDILSGYRILVWQFYFFQYCFLAPIVSDKKTDVILVFIPLSNFFLLFYQFFADFKLFLLKTIRLWYALASFSSCFLALGFVKHLGL